jgi:hypothetical protein
VSVGVESVLAVVARPGGTRAQGVETLAMDAEPGGQVVEFAGRGSPTVVRQERRSDVFAPAGAFLPDRRGRWRVLRSGRRAAYTVKVHDGQEIGYGLIARAGGIYSVQFRDLNGKFIFRSTGETARPRALTKAEEIIKDQYAPPDTINRTATWDEVVAKLKLHLEADGARQATIKDYFDTINQVRGWPCAQQRCRWLWRSNGAPITWSAHSSVAKATMRRSTGAARSRSTRASASSLRSGPNTW